MFTEETAKKLISNILKEMKTGYYETMANNPECDGYHVEPKLNTNYSIGDLNFVIQGNNTIIYFPYWVEDNYLEHTLDECCGFSIDNDDINIFTKVFEEWPEIKKSETIYWY